MSSLPSGPPDDPLTYAIIGAAIEVHHVLGPGFMEAAYHKALIREFEARRIPYGHEVELPLHYKGAPLGASFRADFHCGDVVLEVKALPATGFRERLQTMHYVRATQARVGLLLNFGARRLGVERVDRASVPLVASIP